MDWLILYRNVLLLDTTIGLDAHNFVVCMPKLPVFVCVKNIKIKINYSLRHGWITLMLYDCVALIAHILSTRQSEAFFCIENHNLEAKLS